MVNSALTKFILFVSLAFLIHTGCQIDRPEPPKPIVAVIFCDITASIREPTTFQKVLDYSERILDSLYLKGYKGYFLPLYERTSIDPPIVEGSFEGINPGGPVYKSSKDTLRNYLSRYLNAQRRREATCVLDAIPRAGELFNSVDKPSNYRFHLIFISDMLEECTNGLTNDYLNLRINGSRAYSDSTLTRRIAQSLKKEDFGFNDVSVKVILTSDTQKEHNNLKVFWKNVFKELGIKSVYIGASFPDNLWQNAQNEQ